PKPRRKRRSRSKHKITMTSAKWEANARNARLSRGPLRPETKRRCSLNAVRDGLYAETIVLPGESVEQYNHDKAIWLSRLDVDDGAETFFAAAGFDASWQFTRGS